MRMMMVAACALMLVGCANSSVVNVKRDNLGSAPIGTIFVPRFEGNPEFVEEGTDFFVSELEAKTNVNVLQGDPLRPESTDVLSGGNLAPTGMAISAAKRHGAQLVVMGKVTSYGARGTLNGFASVRVVDVETGKVFATIHRPSGLLVSNSEHQAAMAAVKRAADDVADAIGH